MICGIDEAGRGPVIGPLMVAGVMAPEKRLKVLEEIGVKDSKKLTKKKRSELYGVIKRHFTCFSIKLDPPEIDALMGGGKSLNNIEAMKFSEVINFLKPRKAFIDAADVNAKNFQRAIERRLELKVELIVEHKADENYPIVSAASIIAKVERDSIVERLCREYGNLGSGYPSDPTTVAFLEEWFEKNRRFPDFIRKSWKTLEPFKNKKLGDYL